MNVGGLMASISAIASSIGFGLGKLVLGLRKPFCDFSSASASSCKFFHTPCAPSSAPHAGIKLALGRGYGGGGCVKLRLGLGKLRFRRVKRLLGLRLLGVKLRLQFFKFGES